MGKPSESEIQGPSQADMDFANRPGGDDKNGSWSRYLGRIARATGVPLAMLGASSAIVEVARAQDTSVPQPGATATPLEVANAGLDAEATVPESTFPMLENGTIKGIRNFNCRLDSIQSASLDIGPDGQPVLEVRILGLVTFKDKTGNERKLAVVLGARNATTNKSFVGSFGVFPRALQDGGFNGALDQIPWQQGTTLQISFEGKYVAPASNTPDGVSVVSDAVKWLSDSGLPDFVSEGLTAQLTTVQIGEDVYPLVLTVDAQPIPVSS